MVPELLVVAVGRVVGLMKAGTGTGTVRMVVAMDGETGGSAKSGDRKGRGGKADDGGVTDFEYASRCWLLLTHAHVYLPNKSEV